MTAPPARVEARAQVRTPKSQNRTQSLSMNMRRAAAWSMGSTIVFKIAGITTTAIVARILTRQDFGLFAVATTVYTIVSAFGGSGLTTSLTRADLRLSDIAPTMWTFSLGTNVLVAGALMFFAQPIAAGLGSPDGAGPIRVMAIVAILDGLSAVPSAQLIRDFKQSKLFLGSVVSFAPATAVLIFLAKSGDGAMAFAWSRVVGTALVCIVVLISVRSTICRGYREAGSRFSITSRFHSPLQPWSATCCRMSIMHSSAISWVRFRLVRMSWHSTCLLAFLIAGRRSRAVAGSAFSRVKHDRERLMDAIVDGVRAVVLSGCAYECARNGTI